MIVHSGARRNIVIVVTKSQQEKYIVIKGRQNCLFCVKNQAAIARHGKMGNVKHVTKADARQLTKTITPTHHDLFANRYKDVLDVVLACLALTQFNMTCCFFFVLAARSLALASSSAFRSLTLKGVTSITSSSDMYPISSSNSFSLAVGDGPSPHVPCFSYS
jgi:hypothetical protein